MEIFWAKRSERPVSSVPKNIIVILLLFFTAQLIYHRNQSGVAAVVKPLTAPFEEKYLAISGLSDQIFTAKVLMLWLQAQDNQPGISIPYKDLDYNTLKDWLVVIQSLDENMSYPQLSASRLYSKVLDDDKKRIMLEFVKESYLKRPDQRWQWMAHCVYVAKYELKDLNLALEYGRLIREHTSKENAPVWARQMELFILEDLNEIESAKILIGGLLESGDIIDNHELSFLKQRLQELEAKKQ